METSNGNPDLTDPFWLSHGDSNSFKGRMERELGNGQLGMKRSGNEETTMYKDRLPSPSSSHLLSIHLLVFLRSRFPAFCVV